MDRSPPSRAEGRAIGNARRSVRLTPLLRLAFAALVAVATMPLFPPSALAHDECANAWATCVSVSSGQQTIGRMATIQGELMCPSSYPILYNWSWDKSSD